MKKKILLVLSSIIFSLCILELGLRFFVSIPELEKSNQRRDVSWTEKNVVLSSAGYRDKEYSRDRVEDAFRIYVIGDSFTYGWLIDNVEKVYPKLIEQKLPGKIGKKVEVINAGSPGFSIQEEVDRYITEGKFYHPDLILLGINVQEPNISGLKGPSDPPVPGVIKKTYVYQFMIANLLRAVTEKQNYMHLKNIYQDQNSKDWQEFSHQVLTLSQEGKKINAKLAILVFPYINPKKPNAPYDLYEYNDRFKEFGKKNDIAIIDPLKKFLEYQDKEKLRINPLDAHPTEEMNRLAAESFLEQFDAVNFLKTHTQYTPTIKNISLPNTNNSIGTYSLIRNISSIQNEKWVYFELKNENGLLDLPIADTSSRATKVYVDRLQTAKSSTEGVLGGSILYYVYPKDGKIIIPTKIYGYEIVGFENIFGLYEENAAVAADYIMPLEIRKDDRYFTISYKKLHPYHVFKVSVAVSVKQIDIDTKGVVKNTAETYVITHVLEKDSNEIIIPFSQTILATPQFFEGPENGARPYVFVDNVFTKVDSINVSENKIIIIFNSKLRKGQEIELPIKIPYSLEKSPITIQIEE